MKLSDRFKAALVYAARKHAGQKRTGTEIPYVAHRLGVANIALTYGADEDEAIAALLHDAVEDQGGEETGGTVRGDSAPPTSRLRAEVEMRGGGLEPVGPGEKPQDSRGETGENGQSFGSGLQLAAEL